MNKEVKALWLDALRSGKYEQGLGTLCDVNDDGDRKFCCLGVLCDVAIEQGLPIEVQVNSHTTIYDDSSGYLPDSVREWAGLASYNPLVKVNGEERAVAQVNDTGDFDFPAIADLIEASL